MSIAPPTYLPNDPRQPAGQPTNPAANLGHLVTCEDCGVGYRVVRLRPDRGHARRCTSCRGKAGQAKAQAGFITPDADHAKKIRANGLVNKRLKLGFFARPAGCQKCGKKKRLDAHHESYDLPHLVHYLCRGCHNLSHRRPGYLADVMPTDTGGLPDPRQQNQATRTTLPLPASPESEVRS